jgi:DedD protein
VTPEDEREKPPAPSPADTTLLEDFAGTEPPAEQTAPVAAEPEESAEPSEPAAEPEPDRRANRRNRGKAAEPADATPAPSPAREEPAIPKGSVVIQVFSSQDRSQAERIRRRLSNGGEKAYLSPVEVGGHTMYRVRIGPFSSRADAQKVAEKVRKDYEYDTWITE